jgi:two-component system cell cycle sensor histidine kinase/response regulator CckA
MVQDIVKQCGGSINVNSTMGKGTTFLLNFPAIYQCVSDNSNMTNDNIPAEELDPKTLILGKTILYVEDEEGVREIVEEMLKNKGYAVIAVKNGAEALAVYGMHKDKIGLIITDIMMPDLRGDELCKIIRQDNHEIKIIYLSGYSGDAVGELNEEDKNTIRLEKPISFPLLLSKIHKFLTSGNIIEQNKPTPAPKKVVDI